LAYTICTTRKLSTRISNRGNMLTCITMEYNTDVSPEVHQMHTWHYEPVIDKYVAMKCSCSNILIQDNTAKIADSGLSSMIKRHAADDQIFPFTPHYLAPEAVTYQGYVAASDVWSLGCMLYEMCSLKHAYDFPFGGSTTKMLFRIVKTGTNIDSPKIPANYSPHIQRIIDLYVLYCLAICILKCTIETKYVYNMKSAFVLCLQVQAH
jgi:serine/threonine protein kinase